MVFTGPSACEYGEPLGRISSGLAVWDERTQSNRAGPPMTVPGLARPVVPTLSRLPDNYLRARASLPGRWRGLTVTGVETVFVPETDDIAHYVTFAEPRSRALAVLIENGLALDPATGEAEVDVRVPDGQASAGLFLEPRGSGSALGCVENY
jgi:hypothetical protein